METFSPRRLLVCFGGTAQQFIVGFRCRCVRRAHLQTRPGVDKQTSLLTRAGWMCTSTTEINPSSVVSESIIQNFRLRCESSSLSIVGSLKGEEASRPFQIFIAFVLVFVRRSCVCVCELPVRDNTTAVGSEIKGDARIYRWIKFSREHFPQIYFEGWWILLDMEADGGEPI